MRSLAVVFLLISVLFVNATRAQSNELIIQGQTGKLYLIHTVVAKENWYSIGRLYNMSPKSIAPFNSLTIGKPLSIGQQLEIPLTVANFSQNGLHSAGETLVPVYHIVQEKEWMYRVSVNHNKVPIGKLEEWNHITKDEVKAGMHLVVGFLKVKTAQSALATGTPAGPPAHAAFAGGGGVAVKEESDRKGSDSPAVARKVPVVKKVEVTSHAATEPVETEETKTDPQAGGVNKTFNGGYFRSDYADGGKSASGQAGVFKSTSGWQDGKYYALMNSAPVGMIVKISLPPTNKTIYAKVLGQLPDMKESAGLTIRISNAAAAELGAGEGRFNVEVQY